MIALEARDLRIAFGALRAVDGVDLTVAAGSRHALIGPNGAGKSTLFKLLTGGLRADGGTVSLGGRDVTRLSEVRRCRLGLGQTTQHVSLFASFTVQDTVALAVRRHERSRTAVRTRAAALVEQVGLAGRGAVLVPALSHGERKQLDVALALACEPSVLLLDEPAAGMSPAESERLLELLRALPGSVTVLFVEHDLDLVFGLADQVTVLHLGRVLLSGSPDDARNSDAVAEAYLGTEHREELFTP
ncbi:ABC transporter ATP-binding protein [Cryptosporangium aurantiacum]|uniref:Amino acid/amide ABC transporter ATP-binding protein 1, HAAT family n=1 Tax=Cryptosporangium aurantiacum TaxID=134849 RepID=A0A1M7R0U7_9ACTN|nr:ABC transporter ATP-binding protein [Cryptosporangium aurantiacum]SHN38199.1 amino acid/amide ABC transporter ATP-binding protein 1, HAAT family [Cryptosporangium aurantiacum]